MSPLEIKVRLSAFFPRNLEITEKRARSLIGLPIKDENGVPIGIVHSVDWEAGEWTGYIVDDGSIREYICENYERSMQIEKEKDEK